MPEQASRSLKILLAEDNTGDVFLVRKALEAHGIINVLTVVGNGEAALETLRQVEEGPADFDLIIADLNLPRFDGGQIVTAARASERLRNTPIILMTSSDSPVERNRVMQIGATKFFRKPSDLQSFMEIGNIIKAAVGKHLTAERSG